MVTAHVTKEGTPQEDGAGSVRQRIEVETEQITRGDENFAVNAGLRVNVYQQSSKNESEPDKRGVRSSALRYGERLRFPAKISLPRNYRNPGAFDYQGYLIGKRNRRSGLDQSRERRGASRLCRQPG